MNIEFEKAQCPILTRESSMRAAFLFLIVLFCLLFIANESTAQSNIKYTTLQIDRDTFLLDTIPFDQASLELTYGSELLVQGLDYTVFGKQIIITKKPRPSILFAKYRVLPFSLTDTYFQRDTTLIGKRSFDDVFIGQPVYEPFAETGGSFPDVRGLNYSGNFTRGISFGNNQDLVLNSSFNLRMSGIIGDDIEITAAISDNTIPIQPEGNTQQLNEFDKVFIQLKKDRTTLIAGDYDLSHERGYFLKYFRKLQGVSIRSSAQIDSTHFIQGRASVAVSRGKFSRNQFLGQEGNQGPYRLTGQEGETFIIVLSGSERVYIDGQRMTRGQDADYIIDYNRGDVSFTTNRLITKDSRIDIEFEYNDRNYLRSLYAADFSYSLKDQLTVYGNLLSIQDGKNSAADLSANDRTALGSLGDAISNTFVNSAELLTEFDANRILYKLIDTTSSSILYDSIFVYSTNPDSALYALRWTEVGFGNGNYIITQSGANGRVYAWVAPDPITGIPQGNFEPVVRLVAPELQQLYSLGAEWKPTKGLTISSEGSMSTVDLNRLSDIDDSDNQNFGIRSAASYLIPIGQDSARLKGDLSFYGSHEFIQSKFEVFTPYRPREFARDWNAQTSQQRDEHWITGGAQFQSTNKLLLKYEVSSLLTDSIYTGIKQTAAAKSEFKNTSISATGSYLQSESLLENTDLLNGIVQVQQDILPEKKLTIGARAQILQNQRRDIQTDTLNRLSESFQQYSAFIESQINTALQVKLTASRRYDQLANGSDFAQAETADELQFTGNWQHKKKSTLTWNARYRNLQINRPDISIRQAEDTYLGRLDHNYTAARGAVRLNTFYEISSGQEQKVEYTYLQVNPGDGFYTWIDRNDDSLKQVNEFEIAVFQDQADHIRIITLTNDFIRTNTVLLGQTLQLNPKAIWNNKTGIRKFISKFSFLGSIQVTRKTRESNEVVPWNPFQLTLSDTALVSSNSTWRSTLYFNRGIARFNAEVGMTDNRQQNVLTTGPESRSLQQQFIQGRSAITKTMTTTLRAETGIKAANSGFFNDRDYRLRSYSIEPELAWIYKRRIRLSSSYEFTQSKNTLPNTTEQVTGQSIQLKATLNDIFKSTIRAETRLVNLKYNQTLQNTPVEYALLEGLNPGSNYLWSLTLDRNIGNNILMSLTYDGRTSSGTRIIHTGRARLTAAF